MTGKVDKNIDLRIADRLQDFTVALVLAIDKAMKGPFQSLAQIAVIARTDREGVCLKSTSVVVLRRGLTANARVKYASAS